MSCADPVRASTRNWHEAAHEGQRHAPAPSEIDSWSVFDSVRAQTENPVQPVKLGPADTSFTSAATAAFPAGTHCCHGADITLPPYDILRLRRTSACGLPNFSNATPCPPSTKARDMPVVKLKMGGDDGKGACPFLAPKSCTVYADRPSACRYYPLGLISVSSRTAKQGRLPFPGPGGSLPRPR